MQLSGCHLLQNFRLKTDPAKEPAVAYQPYALKSGDFARLTNDLRNASLKALDDVSA